MRKQRFRDYHSCPANTWQKWIFKPGLFYSAIYCYWASMVAQMVKSLHAMQETQVGSPSREDPLEKGMAMHSSILQNTVHGVTKNWTQLSDFHFHLTSQLIYNVLPISAIQQSDSVLYILFKILFSFIAYPRRLNRVPCVIQ